MPHEGPAATALAEGPLLAWLLADGPAAVGAAVAAADGDGVETAPGAAQAAIRMAVTASAATRAAWQRRVGTAAIPMLTMNTPPVWFP